MAEIAPFRGLRYNPDRVPDLAKVVIPPYDVISPKEQQIFHATSPYNMVHLELGTSTPEDSETNNPHTRAAKYLREWRENRVLIRDEEPAIYYYELDYALAPGVMRTRYGFICALRLEDFSSGFVRPHEKTFQTIKDERLRLMLACQTNLSPVFALYSDPDESVDHSLKSGRNDAPIASFKDSQGMEHRFWKVTNPDVLRQVNVMMRDKALFIADGHHRYETALNYRAIQRERFKDASPCASFEYIMVYLSNLNQEGLTILPTHRLIRNLDSWEPELFLERAKAFFEVSRYDTTEAGEAQWRSALAAGGAEKKTVIGFYAGKGGSYYLLMPKEDQVLSYLARREIPEVLRSLDVVVLDQVVLKEVFGLSEEFLANAGNIHFKHDLGEALSEIKSGNYEAGFLINATRIEQVQEVATAGLIMPHKSTYFYPKVGSGMVIHQLSTEEEGLC